MQTAAQTQDLGTVPRLEGRLNPRLESSLTWGEKVEDSAVSRTNLDKPFSTTEPANQQRVRGGPSRNRMAIRITYKLPDTMVLSIEPDRTMINMLTYHSSPIVVQIRYELDLW